QFFGQPGGFGGGFLPSGGGRGGGGFLRGGFGGEGLGLGGAAAGSLGGLPDRFFQPAALGFGPDPVVGGGARLPFGGGQLGGHRVGLAFGLVGPQPGGGAVPRKPGDLVLQFPYLLPAGE